MTRAMRAWCASLALLAGSVQAADTVVDDNYLASGGDGSNWPAYGALPPSNATAHSTKSIPATSPSSAFSGSPTCPTSVR